MKTTFLILIVTLVLSTGVRAQVSPGAYLGVYLTDLDEARARVLKSPEARGALVGKVIKGSPADKAGLQENDIIISFDTQPIFSATSVYTFLSEVLPGSSVLLRLIRAGSEQDVTVIVNERQNLNDKNASKTRNIF